MPLLNRAPQNSPLSWPTGSEVGISVILLTRCVFLLALSSRFSRLVFLLVLRLIIPLLPKAIRKPPTSRLPKMQGPALQMTLLIPLPRGVANILLAGTPGRKGMFPLPPSLVSLYIVRLVRFMARLALPVSLKRMSLRLRVPTPVFSLPRWLRRPRYLFIGLLLAIW